MAEGSNIFSVIFWIIIFFIIFALGLNVIVGTGITTIFELVPTLSGIEAFAFYNLMLWLVLGFIIWVLYITR